MLMENQSTHNPNILDPLMASKVHIYIHGDSEEVVGFKLTDNIQMCRQQKLESEHWRHPVHRAPSPP